LEAMKGAHQQNWANHSEATEHAQQRFPVATGSDRPHSPRGAKARLETTAAIERLNRNPSRLQDPQYQEYLKSNADAARALSSRVKDFADYGKTRNALERLEKRLEITRQ
jgi:hypothetical protein